MNQPMALVIDDEPDICELLTLTLGRMNIGTESAVDISSAKKLLGQHRFDICLTDMRLPDGDGLELVDWIQHNATGLPVAVITAHGNVETAVQALKLGAFDFISKPLDLGNLRKIVENALRVSAERQAGQSKLLGESARINELRDMIDKVSRSQAPVHISGESGTGKELVARLIHESGPRVDGPFTAVNCGAIPAELMESEFFGHRKGSFTGAINDKAGLFQCSENGTLFLDEIADLPLAMQVKLLRVIQEKKVRPVGAAKEESVDVRILSATHRNLAKMVANDEFREDLYYRINVIELHVPALRERGHDVLLLTDFILDRLNTKATLDESAKNALLSYAFPGNVRELENMLERAVTLCTSGTISADDLYQRPAADTSASNPALEGKLGDQVEDIQRQAIIEALEKTRYNKTAAAKLLGLSFRQLRYRIKKLGIE
ncbi:MAG: sigma-54-dependent transcriptional regulator [Woeseiaceae bacterium]